MATCKNKQMGAGLKSRVEGNLHVVRVIWPHSAGWEYDSTDAYGKEDISSSPPPSPPPVAQEEPATEEAPPLTCHVLGSGVYHQHYNHIHMLRISIQELTLIRAAPDTKEIQVLTLPFLMLKILLVR